MKIIIFDLDGVLVDVDSSWKLIHRAFETDNEQNLNRYLCGTISYAEFMRRDIRLWGKVQIAQIKAILDSVPLIGNVSTLILELKKNGFKTAIISSGISILADRVKNMLGIDYSYANRLSVDHDGWLTGECEEVVELLRKDLILNNLLADQRVDANQCIVIGDTKFDISLFEQAGLSIAFNPKDEDVKKAADLVINHKDLCQIMPWLNDEFMNANFALKFKSSKLATMIMRSISPDNYTLPLGLSLRTWSEGKIVYVKIFCTKGATTLLATLDDLFACMQVAEETIDAVSLFR